LCAKEFDKPVFVCAESYKFSRFFPLVQEDLPVAKELEFHERNKISQGVDLSMNTGSDLTPGKLINLLLTDLGVFTPQAISDEMNKTYND
jgi:translation initiation factor eIF-2B subunit alpha